MIEFESNIDVTGILVALFYLKREAECENFNKTVLSLEETIKIYLAELNEKCLFNEDVQKIFQVLNMASEADTETLNKFLEIVEYREDDKLKAEAS